MAKTVSAAPRSTFAAQFDQPDIVRLLLAAKAAHDTRAHGRTALMLAALGGHSRVVEQLIAAGAEVDVQSTHSDSRRTRSPCLQAHSEAGV
jgi:ankyrin repeat protein